MKLKSLFLSILIPGIAITGCSKSKVTDTKSQAKAIAVKVAMPKRQDLQNIYTATGSLESLKVVELSCEVTGKIKKLNVDEGDKVYAGMVVAEIDDSTQKAQLAQAEASLSRMKAEWEKIKTGARPQELSTAQQSAFEAKTMYEQSSTDYLRMKNLFESGVVTKQELDNAETQLKVKKAALQRAEENLSMVKEGARKEEKDALYASLQETQAQVEYARTQMAKTKIISPIDGVVTQRYKQVGDMVSAQPITNIFRIEKVDPLKAVFRIPQEDLNLVKLNQTIKLVGTDGKEYPGTVSLISPSVDVASHSVKVECSIPNKNLALKPGLFIEGRILLELKRNILIIPMASLQKSGGDSKTRVFVVRDGMVHASVLTAGIQQDGMVEVLGGVAENEPVVIAGFEKFSDGDKVQISKPE